MSDVPIIRMLSPLLGKIGSGPFRTELMGPVLEIIPCLSNPFGSKVPVDIPDVLGVTV